MDSHEIINLEQKNLTIPIRNVRQDIPKYFAKEYIKEKLKEIKDNEERMFITFLWMSGVRVTEAISITRKDLNNQQNILTIKWLKSRKWNDRNIPLHPILSQLLAIYTGGMPLNSKVFNFTRQRAWQITKKCFNTNPHTFRHSFAVNYLREGGNIVNLYRLLGHSKIQTTMEYLKIVPTDLAKELETINF